MLTPLGNAWLRVQGRWGRAGPGGCWSSSSGQGGRQDGSPRAPCSELLPTVTALGLRICKRHQSQVSLWPSQVPWLQRTEGCGAEQRHTRVLGPTSPTGPPGSREPSCCPQHTAVSVLGMTH